MKSILLGLVLVFGSCSLFQEKDAAPAVESANSMLTAFNSTSMGFESFVTSTKVTMTDDVRAALVANIKRDRTDFNTMHATLLDWLAQMGTVNWQDLYFKFREIYDSFGQ